MKLKIYTKEIKNSVRVVKIQINQEKVFNFLDIVQLHKHWYFLYLTEINRFVRRLPLIEAACQKRFIL